jgi:putative peptidoglycan lipid II flippase
MSKKFTSTVAGATVFLIIFNVLAKGFGFLREAIFAFYFGLSKNYEVYLIGAVVPITINTILNYLSFNFFIPNYKKIKAEDPTNTRANKFLMSTFIIFVSGGIFAALLLFFASNFLVGLYITSSTEAALAKNVLLIYLFTIPLNAGSSIISAYFNSEGEFRIPAYSQLILNIIVIAAVFIFAGNIDVYIIPLGFLAGVMVQIIYLLFKTKYISFKISYLKEIKQYYVFTSTLIIIVLTEIIGQLYVIIDRLFYGQIETGGIAALYYSSAIFILPITIFSFAFSTVLFPKFSDDFYNKTEETANNFTKSLKVNFLIFLPIVFVLFFYSEIIIKILFERGQFGAADTKIAGNVLQIFSISLIFYSSYALVNKLLYGMRAIKMILFVAVFSIVIKIILSLLLVEKYFQNGLALSSSISYIVMMTSATIIASHKLKKFKISIIVKELLILLSIATISYMVTIFIFPSEGSLSMKIVELFFFTSIYCFLAYILKVTSISILKNSVLQIRNSYRPVSS